MTGNRGSVCERLGDSIATLQNDGGGGMTKRKREMDKNISIKNYQYRKIGGAKLIKIYQYRRIGGVKLIKNYQYRRIGGIKLIKIYQYRENNKKTAGVVCSRRLDWMKLFTG